MSGTVFPFQFYSLGSNSAAKGGWGNAANNATNGRYYNYSGTAVWDPASGRRDYPNGAFTNVGSGGYCWSSSVNSNLSYFRYLSAATVYPAIDNARALSYPMGCIQD